MVSYLFLEAMFFLAVGQQLRTRVCKEEFDAEIYVILTEKLNDFENILFPLP